LEKRKQGAWSPRQAQWAVIAINDSAASEENVLLEQPSKNTDTVDITLNYHKAF
jgi:hypothetical protein